MLEPTSFQIDLQLIYITINVRRYYFFQQLWRKKKLSTDYMRFFCLQMLAGMLKDSKSIL